KSFVRNIGCDASGIHCASESSFEVQLTAFYRKIKKIPIKKDTNHRKAFESFFKKVIFNNSSCNLEERNKYDR
ncbi:MAG: hypothetical protein LBS23_01745, partial [Holosporaceae bacterium]|nr:hypothetical protein [Holosporaceae bacterium]